MNVHKVQSGKHKGRNSKHSLNLDVMLVCGPDSCSRFSMVPVEMQGSSHSNSKQQAKDEVKAQAVKDMGLDQVQAVCVCQFLPSTAVRSDNTKRQSTRSRNTNYVQLGQGSMDSMITQVIQACQHFKPVEELTKK